MDKEPNSSDMVLQLFGERQRFTNKSAHTLSKGAVKPLDVLGAFAMAVMAVAKDDGLVGSP